jgi:hypothetical protein
MKRRLKQAAAGCALALSAAFGGAAAQETAAPLPAPTPVADIIGACVSASGKPVEIRMNDSYAVRVARAIDHPRRGPLIDLSTRYFTAATPLISQRFFAAHECAHHRLGHIERLVEAARTHAPVYDSDIQQMEEAADCAAAHALQDKYGYTAAEIAAVFDTAPKSDSFTHFSNEVRAKDIRACLAR